MRCYDLLCYVLHIVFYVFVGCVCVCVCFSLFDTIVVPTLGEPGGGALTTKRFLKQMSSYPRGTGGRSLGEPGVAAVCTLHM